MIYADINSAGDGWIQVTLSGPEAAILTEKEIEEAMSDMFVIQKLNAMKEQLDRIEKLLKERPVYAPSVPFSGAPAQRSHLQQQELMPKLQVKVEKKK